MTDLEQVYGKLRVLEEATRSRSGKRRLLCQCECGSLRVVEVQNLRNGNSRSCGRYPCADRAASRRLAPGEQARGFIFLNYQSNARHKGRAWDISRERFDALTASPCHYCGAVPQNRTRDRNGAGAFVYSGLDRVDPAEGYTIDNVVPACIVCNRAKTNMSAEDFLAWACRVAERTRGGDANGTSIPPRGEQPA
ncbi:MAG TPA: hypothetical protein VII01_01645 [Solirubrobacteraceae bacterium]